MSLTRAYSLIEIKDFNDEKRQIAGWATTPTPDRVSDVIAPLGVRAAPDIPLFLYHDSTKTVGRARLDTPVAKGVWFTATLPKIADPGTLRDRVDEAWGMVKNRLITGVSVGFIPAPGKTERLPTGGTRFLEIEVIELSICPIPMNAEATIQTVKSAYHDVRRAASGSHDHADVSSEAGAEAAFDKAYDKSDAEAMKVILQSQAFRQSIAQRAAKRAEELLRGCPDGTTAHLARAWLAICAESEMRSAITKIQRCRFNALTSRIDRQAQQLSAPEKRLAAFERRQ